MTARGIGGKTPDRVVKLLKQAVEGSSQSAVARNTGLRLYSIQRYLKGIGEPSQATIEKLADYFDVSVTELRGEMLSMPQRDIEMLCESLLLHCYSMQHMLDFYTANPNETVGVKDDCLIAERFVTLSSFYCQHHDPAVKEKAELLGKLASETLSIFSTR